MQQNPLLDINIIDGPVPILVALLSAAAAAYLLARRPTVRRAVTLFGFLLLGATTAFAVKYFLVDVLDVFGTSVAPEVTAMFVGFGALTGLALSNLSKTRPRRKLIAGSSLIIFATATTLAINASFGLTPTVAAFLHINNDPAISLVTTPATASPTGLPLFATWTPPTGITATGTTGQLSGTNALPNTASGFPARNAEIYYPPAALVPHPPALPFVLMMMGQPGDPSARNISDVLNRYAATHNGLAPIVIVADQLGDPTKDPLCIDSPMGNAETYLMKDVVPWAKAHLNVLTDPKFWTVAGYSNGGACASYLGAKYPAVFGNILDLSGTEFAGTEQESNVLKTVFHSNQAAYNAIKPINIMARSTYPDTRAIYTVGQKDPALTPGLQRTSEQATLSGMTSTFAVIPGADHGATALNGGLDQGFALLYPRLGLSPTS